MRTLNLSRLPAYVKDVVEVVKDSKSAVIFILAFVLVSDIREYPILLDIVLEPAEVNRTTQELLDVGYYPGKSVINIMRSILRFCIYPINMWLFQMEFSKINVPEVFILLVPLVVSFSIGLLVIIFTED